MNPSLTTIVVAVLVGTNGATAAPREKWNDSNIASSQRAVRDLIETHGSQYANGPQYLELIAALEETKGYESCRLRPVCWNDYVFHLTKRAGAALWESMPP